MMLLSTLVSAALLPALALGSIDRQRIVSQFNVIRTSLIDNNTTPLQVGNGNFAFNVDNTGMQVRVESPARTLSMNTG
ncbi:six-hairpin glycosidase-like protein [Colletotrichum tofieldiae]|nr:six-hairpin glycosidase-like protein [Colletotrichum tofieldiae]